MAFCSLLTLACHGPTTTPTAPTVVVLVVDTLRADRLGVYGHPRNNMPGLTARAEGGAVFERCFSTSSWTLPSFGSLLTGRYPFAHGAGWKDPEEGVPTRFPALFEEVPTVAESLSRHGWSTTAVVTNSFLRQRFGLALGFDVYDFASTREAGERTAVVQLRALLRATVPETPLAKPEPVALDPELEAELEALGYLVGDP